MIDVFYYKRKFNETTNIEYLVYLYSIRSPGKEESDRDIHSEISETARKLAQIELHNNTENIPEPHNSSENIEPKSSPEVSHPVSLFTNKVPFNKNSM